MAKSPQYDNDALHINEAGEINGLAEKASPVAADMIVIEDSAAGFVKKKSPLTTLLGGGGGGGGVTIWKLGKPATHGDSTQLRVDYFEFDPSALPAITTIDFRAVWANGNETVTSHVQLYNLTDSDEIANLSLTGAGATVFQSQNDASIVVGASAGEMDNASKLYMVRIFVDSPSLADDTIEFGGAELRVTFT